MTTAPRTRTRGRRNAEASRAAILAAARDVFTEHGFHGARTNQIAAAAGVPQGLLYHYFESKERLFHEVLKEAFTPYFQATIDMLVEHDGTRGIDLLEQAVGIYFDFLRENPQVVRLKAWAQAIQVHLDSPQMLDPELCATPMALGAQRIGEAQAAGLMRRDIEPEHIIQMFLDLCLSWFMSYTDHVRGAGIDVEDQPAMDRLHDLHRESIIRFVRAGVAPQET